jgi:O-methyltransferase
MKKILAYHMVDLLIDDYGFPSCEGARKAVDKFLEDKIEKLITTPSGPAYLIKL